MRTDAVPDEHHLREQAREAIRSGKLPARSPVRLFSGPGSGVVCPVCSMSVKKNDDVAIALEFKVRPLPDQGTLREVLERLHATLDVHRYELHVRCFAAWEFERTEVDRPTGSRPSA